MDRHPTHADDAGDQADASPGLRTIFSDPGAYMAGLRANLRRRKAEGRWGAPVFLGVLAALVLLGFVIFIYLMAVVPSGEDLAQSRYHQATVVLSEDGVQLARYYHENRTWVPLDSISPMVVQALIDTEDRRFYKHWGVDVQRTFGAVMRTVAGERQGGSTITMQLVRNVYPEVADDWAFERKAKEWLTALRLEQEYTKNEILEIYLNTVPFNYNAFGIEAAARTYFNKPAAALDAAEAATLVGMLKGTTMYNPVQNPERSKERRDVVLQQMVEAGTLTPEQAQSLSRRPLGVDFHPQTTERNRAPYFAEYVRGWLSKWANEEGYDIYEDGLRVHTTIDSRLQAQAHAAVERVTEDLQAVVDVAWSRRSMPVVSSDPERYQAYRSQVEPFAYFWEANPDVLPEFIRNTSTYRRLVEEGLSREETLERLRSDEAFVDSVKHAMSRLQAGFTAIDPNTGHVKVWVGGSDFEHSKYDHVAQSRRQPGSTFKPFVYAAALEAGYSPNDRLIDQSVHYVDPVTGQEWNPGNFGGETGRAMLIREGLAQSKNTITAQLIIDVGPERVVEMAHALGIESELEAVPSLGLGTSVVTLLEMVAAYASISQNGVYHEPVFVTRIENAEGEVLATFEPETRQSVDPDVAYTVLDMMRGVVDGGTGVRIRGQYGARGDLAGKTGTTQRAADGWFMLAHPELVMGAWVGFPSPAVTFRSQFWGQGAHNALHIVGEFYREVGLSESARFTPPPGYTPPGGGGRLLLLARDGSGGIQLRSAGEVGEGFSVHDLTDAERRSLDAVRGRDELERDRRLGGRADREDEETTQRDQLDRQFRDAFGPPPGRGEQAGDRGRDGDENRGNGDENRGNGGENRGNGDENRGRGQNDDRGGEGGRAPSETGRQGAQTETEDLNRRERQNSKVDDYLKELKKERGDNR